MFEEIFLPNLKVLIHSSNKGNIEFATCFRCIEIYSNFNLKWHIARMWDFSSDFKLFPGLSYV